MRNRIMVFALLALAAACFLSWIASLPVDNSREFLP